MFEVDLEYWLLNSHEKMKVVVSRRCPVCNRTREMEYDRIGNTLSEPSPLLPENEWTVPFMITGKYKFIVPEIECCGRKHYATHIKVVCSLPWEERPDFNCEDFVYEIGSYYLPVVCNALELFPVCRTIKDQLKFEKEVEKQENLLGKRFEHYENDCLNYFCEHWSLMIKEMDLDELHRSLTPYNAVPPQYFVWYEKQKNMALNSGKRNKKVKVNHEVKIKRSLAKQLEDKKPFVFFGSVGYFIEKKMIPGLYKYHWDLARYEKALGKTIVERVLLNFPLIDYFEPLRINAVVSLFGTTDKKSGYLVEYLRRIERECETGKKKHTSLREEILRQRSRIAVLEEKLAWVNIENTRLVDELRKLKALPGEKEAGRTRKSRLLKELIKEMREELAKFQPAIPEPAALEEVGDTWLSNELKGTEVGFSRLRGLTIGIVGGNRQKQVQELVYPCELICADAEKHAEIEWVVNQSDVVVVLIEHISHTALWQTRELAIENEKPLVYSQHINIQLILEAVCVQGLPQMLLRNKSAIKAEVPANL